MRLIDGDALGNRLYHEVFEKDSEDQRWDSGCWMRYRLFEKVLREQPTIEQPEIIHCRDCKNWNDNDGFNHEHGAECTLLRMWMQPDDYCSYGRRKVSE